MLSTENTESTEGKPQTRILIFPILNFFRDFRAFRGPEKDFDVVFFLSGEKTLTGLTGNTGFQKPQSILIDPVHPVNPVALGF